MLDLEHEFFQPAWRRIAIIVITAGWGLVEFLVGEPVWGTGFVALSAFCLWRFFGKGFPEKDKSATRDE